MLAKVCQIRYKKVMAVKKRFFVRSGHAFMAIEEPLNKVGYIPFIGSITALIRNFFGQLQITAGIIVLIIGVIARLFIKPPTRGKRPSQAYLLAPDALNLIGQGILNWGRSLLELIPFLALITTLPYDRRGVEILPYPR